MNTILFWSRLDQNKQSLVPQISWNHIHNQHRQLNLLSDNFYRVVDIPAPEQFPYTKAFAHKDHRLF